MTNPASRQFTLFQLFVAVLVAACVVGTLRVAPRAVPEVVFLSVCAWYCVFGRRGRDAAAAAEAPTAPRLRDRLLAGAVGAFWLTLLSLLCRDALGRIGLTVPAEPLALAGVMVGAVLGAAYPRIRKIGVPFPFF